MIDDADPFADIAAAGRRRRAARARSVPDGVGAPVTTQPEEVRATDSPPSPVVPAAPTPAAHTPSAPAPTPAATSFVPPLLPAAPTAPTPAHGGESDWELFLMRLRYREGRLVRAAANAPILMDDPDLTWVVYTGQVDIFAVQVSDDGTLGPRRFLFQATDGTALFGLQPEPLAGGGFVTLLAVGGQDVQIVRLQRSRLERLAGRPESVVPLVALLDRWVDGISSGIVRGLPPREIVPMVAGQSLALTIGQATRPRSAVYWVTHKTGASLVGGQPALHVGTEPTPLPLSRHLWLEAAGDSAIDARTTTEVLATPDAWAGLNVLHRFVSVTLAADTIERTRSHVERIDRRRQDDRARLHNAYADLSSILAPQIDTWQGAPSDDPLLVACRLVGARLGIEIQVPPAVDRGRESPLAAIARASRMRTRQVMLRDSWWKGDAGPLVGLRAETGLPVALLPGTGGRYELFDPSSGQRLRVTAAVAATLDPVAHMFYRTFAQDALTGRQIAAFALRGCRRDMTAVILTGLAAGALSLLTPTVTQQIFDEAIPGAQRSLLLQMGLGLLVAAIASGLFQITRELAILRLSSRIDGALQSAVMDRLIELSPTFFRAYSAGDLGMRALGINAIRELLARVALSTILTSAASLVSFGLLFYYDRRLAVLATGLTLLLAVVTGVVVVVQMRYQRRIAAMSGQLAGTVFGLFNGIAKLHATGAEDRAFAHWAQSFASARRVAFQDGLVSGGMATFNAAFPVLATATIFGMLAFTTEDRPSIGTFLAFNAAFGQFVSGALGLIGAATSVLQVVPLFERALPILHAIPEVDELKADPGELTGAIDLDHVSFRYGANGPLVFQDVSLHIRPGEMVAIVGPSGSGKSTLLRLLLGFDAPEAGTILYDGRDLRALDVRAIRRQIGTVLQNGMLTSGDIYANIVGASPLSLEDAWEAARLAGLDEDIRKMPMGMHTLVSESGATLSGGQRQRLTIARALVRRPRMVFFDEATSALDNRTQEIVSKSLESLAATRIIIAHRLSTIVNADRIVVLSGGRIVESGTYRELMRRRGLFADLARRQLA